MYPQDNRRKKRAGKDEQGNDEEQWLVFVRNNYEGCVRVDDGSTDDGYAWWTVYPRKSCGNAREVLEAMVAPLPGGFACPEVWVRAEPPRFGLHRADEQVPDGLPAKPTLLGGTP